MTPARLQQIQDLYMEVLEHAPSERAAFLSDACNSDEELKKQVESLLAQKGSIAEVLQHPEVSLLAKALDTN